MAGMCARVRKSVVCGGGGKMCTRVRKSVCVVVTGICARMRKSVCVVWMKGAEY